MDMARNPKEVYPDVTQIMHCQSVLKLILCLTTPGAYKPNPGEGFVQYTVHVDGCDFD